MMLAMVGRKGSGSFGSIEDVNKRKREIKGEGLEGEEEKVSSQRTSKKVQMS